MKHPNDDSAGATTAPSPTVGVFIATFNIAASLPKAIESILLQTRDPNEIIVMDDGSTDGTETPMASIALPKLRYTSQTNQGSAAARNAGVCAFTSVFLPSGKSMTEGCPAEARCSQKSWNISLRSAW